MTPSILIIDDEPLMRLSMLDALKAEGYQVQEASNGEEGMKRNHNGAVRFGDHRFENARK